MPVVFLQLDSLLSSLGGQVGLWLGLSVVTLVEFLELFADVSSIAYKKVSQFTSKVADKEQTKWADKSQMSDVVQAISGLKPPPSYD